MQTKWKSFNEKKQKQLLKDLFFSVLFDHPQLPVFMTEQDWSDMFQQAVVSHIPSSSGRIYSAVLYLDLFDSRYASLEFYALVDFLVGPFTYAKVLDLDLFEMSSSENNIIWFDFNMPAVFLHMSQQQQH